MKILALTDIHAAYNTAAEIMKKEPADVVVIGGDLTTVGSLKEAEAAVERFRPLAPRLFCVAGNMDLPQHDELFERLGVSINGRGEMVNGIGFFGVSGAPLSPLHTPYEITEEEIRQRAETGFAQVRSAYHAVFVPHAPPYGTRVDIVHAGFHAGSTSVREFIEDRQPALVMCGHIHEGRGQDRIEKTRIVNCGQASHGYYALIEIGETAEVSTRQLTL